MIPLEAARRFVEAGRREGSRYELAVPRVVASPLSGLALGSGLGASLEFVEHRDYHHGDDLRHVDWSATARTDRLVVKLHRDEVVPCVDLLVDVSRSMALGAKAEAAMGMAALLATAAEAARFRHRTLLGAQGFQEPPEGPLAELFAGVAFASAPGLADALRTAPPRLRPRGLRVLVSDLLYPDDPSAILSRLLPAAAGLVVVQILGRTDLDPPQEAMLRLEDVETGHELELHMTASARAAYRQALDGHLERWRDAARAHGVVLVTFVAEELASGWDVGPLLRARLLEPA